MKSEELHLANGNFNPCILPRELVARKFVGPPEFAKEPETYLTTSRSGGLQVLTLIQLQTMMKVAKTSVRTAVAPSPPNARHSRDRYFLVR